MSLQLIQNLQPRKCHSDCTPKYLAIYDCGEDEPQQYALLCQQRFNDSDFRRFAEIYDLESGKLVSFEIDDIQTENFEQLIQQKRKEFLANGRCIAHLPVTATVGNVLIKQCAVCAKQLDREFQEQKI